MTDAVYVKNYKAPPVCRREILRYAGGENGRGEVSACWTAAWRSLREN